MGKIVIFGGLGMIGENFIRSFLKKGFSNIVCIDLNCAKYSEKYDFFYNNFSGTRLLPIEEWESIEKELLSADFVFNLTSSVSLDRLILDFCVQNKVRATHFFFGSRHQYAFNESFITAKTRLNPASDYGKGKQLQEDLYREYAKNFKVPVVYLRLSNVYGFSRNFFKKQTFVNVLFKKLIQEESAFFDLSLDNYKDFLYVDDLFSICLQLLQKDAAVGETFLVGSGEKVYLKTIINLISKYYPSAKINFASRLKNQDAFCFDTSKLGHFIDFHPQVDFEVGFKKIKYLIDFS